MKFGLNDYVMMFKKRGIRLPLTYYFQNHLFDIINNTDTHVWLPKIEYNEKLKNFDHGVLYMSSWTNIIKETTDFCLNLVKDHKLKINLIDIGCGKGKVLCVWSKIYKNQFPLIGIEYSKNLSNICLNNLKIINAQNYQVFNCDACDINYNFNSNINIFYLYNPFNRNILKKILRKIVLNKCIVIYNNPVLREEFLNSGFIILKEKKGWHSNAEYSIFSHTL